MVIRDIIATAFRKARIIASGETPAADEADDALAQLQSLILEHPGLIGSHWRDTVLSSSAAITAKDGQRIITSAYAPVVTFPTTVQGCCTTLQMRQFARVLVDGGDSIGLHIFSDAWRRADALTLDSENPLGPETNNGLAAQLASRIGGDYGADVPAKVEQEAMRSERFIRSKFYRRPCGCYPPFRDYA